MITVKSDGKLFVLDTAGTTYSFRVTGSGHLEHLYYGRKIHVDSDDGLKEQSEFAPGNTIIHDPENGKFSMEDIRLEISAIGKGDVREPALGLVNSDGSRTSDFIFDSYEVSKGKTREEDIPGSYGEEADVLKVTLKDKENALKLILAYAVFEECNVITRSCELINERDGDVVIERIMSMQLDFDPGEYSFVTFNGAWAREMNKNIQRVGSVKLVNSSCGGSSSNHANPFVMLGRGAFDEDYGEVYGINLIYSGNHYTCVEKSPFGKVRLVTGINPQGFTWNLAKGESFRSPEAVMTYSASGCNTMSHGLHDFVRSHIVSGGWKDRLRPVLLNSWEAAYFDISGSRLMRLARRAKKAGIELFVMDDGWFKGRNDDSSSLGDWTPDPKKLPHGIAGICNKIRGIGLDFGIWVEPEMVNEDSDLYRAHPDWAMRIPGKPHSTGRNQMVLDLTRTEVQDYIIDAMSAVFSSAEISYVKWDYNRNFSDVYSASLPADRQGEVAHRYILGLYRVMNALTKKFPHILFEGCASGGNRFDLGILSYFPQIWASDDTDAYQRAIIQNGYSYAYPQSCYTCHVSDVPNHQTLRRTPLDTRFNVALFGNTGYECNLCDLPKEEFEEVKRQIEFIKANRKLMQTGRLWRVRSFDEGSFYKGPSQGGAGNEGKILSWTISAVDGSEAMSLIMQSLATPNENQDVLYVRGLDCDTKYRIENRENTYDLRGFGGLVNYVAPFHVKQDGFIHRVIAKFYKMPSEKESHEMYGDAMMYAGVHIKPRFAALGYNENTRYYPDFGSRVYKVEKAG
ncbi:MAG: alpha-galactosidase [Lachnospiraceae bacterium]|nr:alpha-galactosidase [Lachnospiraceae bacterium]